MRSPRRIRAMAGQENDRVWASIFLDFNLPNAATWFYFALILVVALFFKFNRLLSLRNWDVLTLFLLVPGFLLLQESGKMLASLMDATISSADALNIRERADDLQYLGYAWLIAGSGYFLIRCLIDLALERRPVITTNMNLAGLGWMVVALFLCLTAVAVRKGPEAETQVGKGPIVLEQVQNSAAAVVTAQTGQAEPSQFFTVRHWVQRAVAMLSHLSIVLALVLIGRRHFGDTTAGMGAAALYLLLPYTAYHVAQVHHVLPTSLLLWAVYFYQRPSLTGWILGAAAGTAFFPLLLFPLWCGFYWYRGASRFARSFAFATGLCLFATAGVLWIEGQFARNLQLALNLADWQPWLIPTEASLWTGVHWAYRIPVFIAFLAMLLVTAIWPAPKNLAHVIALSAGVLIGIQFWYADQGGVYAQWYMPLLILMVFRPNLMEAEPPFPNGPERAWLDRWGRKIRSNGSGARSATIEPRSTDSPRPVDKSAYTSREERVRFNA